MVQGLTYHFLLLHAWFLKEMASLKVTNWVKSATRFRTPILNVFTIQIRPVKLMERIRITKVRSMVALQLAVQSKRTVLISQVSKTVVIFRATSCMIIGCPRALRQLRKRRCEQLISTAIKKTMDEEVMFVPNKKAQMRWTIYSIIHYHFRTSTTRQFKMLLQVRVILMMWTREESSWLTRNSRRLIIHTLQRTKFIATLTISLHLSKLTIRTKLRQMQSILGSALTFDLIELIYSKTKSNNKIILMSSSKNKARARILNPSTLIRSAT